jgi:cell division protein FtsB
VSNVWVRAAIVASILVMLAVAIVPTLRSLLQQRADTSALRDRVAAQGVRVEELQREAELWRDPAFIEVQARERLGFVRVGDRAYTVIGAGPQRPDPPADLPAVAAPMANDASPWYGKVWQSIQIADRPTAGLTPQK